MTVKRFRLSIFIAHCWVFLSVLSSALHASEYKSVKWDTDLCSCQAKVDPDKLNPAILSHISEEYRSFGASQKFNWWNFRDADVEHVISEREWFAKKANKQIKILMNLKLPDIPIIKKHHRIAVRGLHLDAHLYLAELDFMATGNTDDLKKDFLGEKLSTQCKSWAQIVESEEDTYKTLPKFIEQKCSNNANPKRCEEKSLAKASNDFKSAQLDILIFGWHNCANHQFRKDNVSDYTYKALKEIDPFLKDKVCECDEP